MSVSECMLKINDEIIESTMESIGVCESIGVTG